MRMCVAIRGLFLALMVGLGTVEAYAPVPRITWEHGGAFYSRECQWLWSMEMHALDALWGSVRAGLSCCDGRRTLCEQEALVAASGPTAGASFG